MRWSDGERMWDSGVAHCESYTVQKLDIHHPDSHPDHRYRSLSMHVPLPYRFRDRLLLPRLPARLLRRRELRRLLLRRRRLLH